MEDAEFPLDIITDIFCKLPVKDLLRFKCVSKLWGLTINSQNFIEYHLKNNSYFKVLMSDNSYTLCFIEPNPKEMDAVELEFPICAEEIIALRVFVQVIGLCKGLVALRLTLPHNEHYALWNPSTMEHKKIFLTDDWKNKFSSFSYVNPYGFGYDVVNDDYKIVMICKEICKYPHNKFQFMIYSLRNDSWKMCEVDFGVISENDVSYCTCTEKGDASCNGALHRIVEWREDKTLKWSFAIVAFDVGKEELRQMPLPAPAGSGVKGVRLFDMGGRLRYAEWEMCDFSTVDIWEMKEYGVKESWVKVLCFSDISIHIPFLMIGDSLIQHRFRCIDVIDKLEFPAIDPINLNLFSYYSYKPSLVSIKAFRG